MKARDPIERNDLARRVNDASTAYSGYAYTRYVNNRLARPITHLLANTAIRPNTVTVVGSLITLMGCLTLFASQGYSQIVAGTALLLLGYMLDAVDGQLARVTQQTSKAGALLDHSLDGAKVAVVSLAIGTVYANLAASQVSLGSLMWPSVILAFSTVLHFTVTWQVDTMLKESRVYSGQPEPVSFSYLCRSLFDFGIFAMLPLLAIHPYSFTLSVQFYALANLGFSFGILFRAFRRLQAEER
jgi:phosphatidylglycerophosphate synthase